MSAKTFIIKNYLNLKFDDHVVLNKTKLLALESSHVNLYEIKGESRISKG
jgi:hypothetical protein